MFVTIGGLAFRKLGKVINWSSLKKTKKLGLTKNLEKLKEILCNNFQISSPTNDAMYWNFFIFHNVPPTDLKQPKVLNIGKLTKADQAKT